MATSYSSFTAKVKVKLCLFIFYVSFQALESSAIKESDVAKYFIQRKFGKGDVFSVVFKQECTNKHCKPSDMTKFCNDLSAYSMTPVENFKYSCSCKYAFGTFLPKKGKCAAEKEAAEFLKGKGCSNYLTAWIALFLKAFDLRNNGSHNQYVGNTYQNCKVIPGSPMFYDSLQRRWKRICSEIFSIRFRQDYGIYLEWKADTNRELSGRILRLIVTNYTSTASDQRPLKGCLLFKAVGNVTYDYLNKSVTSIQESATMSALVPTTTTVRLSQETITASLASSSFFLWQNQTSQISDHSKIPFSKIISPSKSETRNTMSFSSTESLINTVVSKTIVKTAINTYVFSVHPSKSSSSTDAASSSAVIDGPGNKKRQTDGNDNGVVIGAAVGGAVVFGIFLILIILFCKRRKPWKSKEKETKLEVKNPVYGKSDNDIQMGRRKGKQATTSNDEDNQPTYQGLSIDTGQINGAALYNSSEDNYDNYTTYQSLDKKVPGSPVYQSLKTGQAATGNPYSKPKPSATRQPSKKHNVNPDPVCNVLEQPGTEQGNMEESLYNVLEGPDTEKDYEVPESDNHGDTQDPLYNVLDGPDAEQSYEAVNVGNASADPLYNVVEGPESTQDQHEPLYNVLESPDAQNGPPGRQGPPHGSNNEPLYNVVEGPDSGGPNKSSADYATPNGPPDGNDNPAYEQTLEFDAPYASVHRPGPQRESVYEPLRGPDRHDLYEPLSERGT